MKKILLLLAVAFFTTTVAFGQFALGVKLGYNASKLTSNLDTIKSDFSSGFHVGAWTRIGKRFYVAPELLYTLSGSVFTKEGSDPDSNWKQKLTVGSMDIPVMLGFKIIHSKALTWRIEVGPEASFVINKKIKDIDGEGDITEADINTANWYILAGTGIDFLFMSLDVRYQFGLNDMIKDIEDWTFESKNSQILVSLGFKIIGKK